MGPTFSIPSKALVLSGAVLLLAGTCQPGESPRIDQPIRDNGLVAFVREGRIHSLDPRTGATTSLTENLDPAGLAWSPDGETLAFLTQATGPAIRVMRPDGRQMRTLMDAGPGAPKLIFGFSRPTWSPDGTRVAFAAAHLSNEGICKAGPTDPPLLELPPWCSQSHVFTLDLERGAPRQLTDGVVVDLDPTWSPHGARIAFVRFDWAKAEEREGAGFDLMLVEAEDGALRSLSSADRVYAGGLAWSPDGKRLLFQDDGSHIYVLEVAGSRITQLVRATTTQSELSDPSWSPDGKTVLFTRRVDGHESVFAIDADGGPERKVVDGCCAAWQPVTPQSESSS